MPITSDASIRFFFPNLFAKIGKNTTVNGPIALIAFTTACFDRSPTTTSK